MREQCCELINSAWIVIFVHCTVNPCEVTIHAQEKKKKETEKRKTWTQDSVEFKRTLCDIFVILIIG